MVAFAGCEALSAGVCDQARGAQPSSATTAIAVLWKKRSCAKTFLGPTAAFMRHLGLAGHAHQALAETAAGDSFADLPAESTCSASGLLLARELKRESRNGDVSWSSVDAER